MISRLSGVLLEKNPPQILLDVAGVGYDVDVPMSSFYNLPECGQKLVLLTHFVVREDGQFLYGFLTSDEREAFRMLIKISGIGARTALSVLSGMSVADLSEAVAKQETGRIIKVPGIGKKTAERLLLELKGKLIGALPAISASGLTQYDAKSDISNALMALGYNEREAFAAMKNLTADITTSEGIRQALKFLAKP